MNNPRPGNYSVASLLSAVPPDCNLLQYMAMWGRRRKPCPLLSTTGQQDRNPLLCQGQIDRVIAVGVLYSVEALLCHTANYEI
jgi:hypothetical protein